MGRRVGLAALAATAAIVAIGPAARADRIIVRHGSIVRGKAIVDEARPDQYLVFGEKGKSPLVLKKERVERIEPEPSVLDGYAERRAALGKPPSAQAHEDLSAWCAANKLPDLATLHAELALKVDPGFAPAHARLGHVLHEGKWLTSNELKVAQGLILHRGSWITAEEKAQIDAEASATNEQKSWSKRLAILKAAVATGPEARSREAEAQLLAIREAAAVAGIARVFGTDPDPGVRKLAAKALAAIPGPEASSALVARLLGESDDDVRVAWMEALARSREDNVVPKLIQALRSKSLATINRAAWGLANLNAVAAIPRLVPALVVTEVQVVWVNPGGNDGSNNPGGLSVSSGYGVGGRSVPVLTPVVGPGVVAYAATSVPASSFGGGTLNIGGGGMSRGPYPTYVPVVRQNVEVLAALVKLTGKDFGYDVPTWQRWLRTSFRPDPVPAKRVPQP